MKTTQIKDLIEDIQFEQVKIERDPKQKIDLLRQADTCLKLSLDSNDLPVIAELAFQELQEELTKMRADTKGQVYRLIEELSQSNVPAYAWQINAIAYLYKSKLEDFLTPSEKPIERAISQYLRASLIERINELEEVKAGIL